MTIMLEQAFTADKTADDRRGRVDNRLVITGRQIKMARAALDWSADRLARQARVSWRTVQRAESPEGIPPRMKIQEALEAAGVEFIHRNNGGVGVRLRRP
jgi:ribosome-binding protein aMBF1 (putative translation factor)